MSRAWFRAHAQSKAGHRGSPEVGVSNIRKPGSADPAVGNAGQGVGGTYTFAHDAASSMYGVFELRRSTFRTQNSAAEGPAPVNGEVLLKLGIVF